MPVHIIPDGHQHEAILRALHKREAYALRMAVRLDLIEGGRALLAPAFRYGSPALYVSARVLAFPLHPSR